MVGSIATPGAIERANANKIESVAPVGLKRKFDEIEFDCIG